MVSLTLGGLCVAGAGGAVSNLGDLCVVGTDGGVTDVGRFVCCRCGRCCQ